MTSVGSLCWGCECGVPLAMGHHYEPAVDGHSYAYPCKFARGGRGVQELSAICSAVLASPETESVEQFASELNYWYQKLHEESQRRRLLADPLPAPRVRRG